VERERDGGEKESDRKDCERERKRLTDKDYITNVNGLYY